MLSPSISILANLFFDIFAFEMAFSFVVTIDYPVLDGPVDICLGFT